MASIFEPPQYQRLLNFEVDQHLGCQSELLNKVWDLANLIEVRFCSGYAKTVALSCFQRVYRAVGFSRSSGVDLNDSWWSRKSAKKWS
jgi:hypothetical protein